MLSLLKHVPPSLVGVNPSSNYLLLHIKMGYCCWEMLLTDCNHWKVTNIKLNLTLEVEN